MDSNETPDNLIAPITSMQFIQKPIEKAIETVSSTTKPPTKQSSYTTSFAFFEAPWEAGITHVFVNLGSDHPSIIEAMVKGKRERPDQFPRIITCPNEMVALSMADGMARLTRKPQCVIVHVDVGTQGLAAAVHNASCGRAPILIFAGLSPITLDGEYRGSRTEYIHWIQDVPDQKQIISQYCRYTGEIRLGRNVKQLVNRALQFATSDPSGPVYLYGTREAMEEEINPYQLDQTQWERVTGSALPQSGVEYVADQLVQASAPLMVVGYIGRNPDSVHAIRRLADTIPNLMVLDTGGSDMCFPGDHPGWLGLKYGIEEHIPQADFIIVMDCDVPWIPTQCKPKVGCKIVHIDVDVLKQQMPVFYLAAQQRYKADSFTALSQINDYLAQNQTLQAKLSGKDTAARKERQDQADKKRKAIAEVGERPTEDKMASTSINPSTMAAALRQAVPEDTIFAVEAVTLTLAIADQIRPVLPKTWINCGGGGLGWSGGGALGIKLAADYYNYPILPHSATNGHTNGTVVNVESGSKGAHGQFVCQIVGDGTFLFSVPSSVYWIAQRYQIPILTIVLNNKGWNAPRRSLLLVHPDGEGSKVDNGELNISFEPTPDFAGIAIASSGGRHKCWGGSVSNVKELIEMLPQAVKAVREDGICAVLEVKLNEDLSQKSVQEVINTPLSG